MFLRKKSTKMNRCFYIVILIILFCSCTSKKTILSQDMSMSQQLREGFVYIPSNFTDTTDIGRQVQDRYIKSRFSVVNENIDLMLESDTVIFIEAHTDYRIYPDYFMYFSKSMLAKQYRLINEDMRYTLDELWATIKKDTGSYPSHWTKEMIEDHRRAINRFPERDIIFSIQTNTLDSCIMEIGKGLIFPSSFYKIAIAIKDNDKYFFQYINARTSDLIEYKTEQVSSTIINNPSCQKMIEIPDNEIIKTFIENLPDKLATFNLNNLQESTDSLTVRVWRPQMITTLNFGSEPYCNEKLFIRGSSKDSLIIKDIDYSTQVLDSLSQYINQDDIINLNSLIRIGVDIDHIIIEIATPNLYKVINYVPFPKYISDNSRKLTYLIDGILDGNLNASDRYSDFIGTVEPGEYRLGSSIIRTDHFPTDIEKKDFYLYAENEIRREFNITDSSDYTKYPYIFIDSESSYLLDLNKYTNKDIESFTILKGNEASAIYGAKIVSAGGVVVVETVNCIDNKK